VVVLHTGGDQLADDLGKGHRSIQCGAGALGSESRIHVHES
jgi:hypothetical protein